MSPLCKTFIDGLNTIKSKFNTSEPNKFLRTILYRDKNYDRDSNFNILQQLLVLLKNFDSLFLGDEIRICDLRLRYHASSSCENLFAKVF